MKSFNSRRSMARLFRANKSMKKVLWVILSAMAAGGLNRAQAQILNVNFIDDSIDVEYAGTPVLPAPSAMSGAAVIGSAGDTWNGLGGFTYSAYPNGATFTSGTLLYANGAASAITLSLSAPSGTYDANASGFGNHSPFSWASLADENGDIGYPYTPYAVLMASCLVANSTTATGFVTLSGLVPNAPYNLYTYNASDQNEAAGRASTFTVNGVTQVSTYDGVTTNLVQGVDYLAFAGVTASASGTLTIDFGDMINSESDFNGFQLQPAAGAPPPPPPPPVLSAISPSGATLCTNTELTCTITSASNTITNVQLIITTSVLGGTGSTTLTTNLTSAAVTGLGTPTAVVNYPLTSNLIYSVAVVGTDSTNVSRTNSAHFDTLAPALVIEASDFNFSGGQFIDTPPDGGLWLYYSASAQGQEGVDENKNTSVENTKVDYRPADNVVIQDANPSTLVEQKFVLAAAEGNTTNVELEVGYNSPGDWLDYSRTYGSGGSAPAGDYDVWLYMVTDGGGIQTSLYQITSNPALPNQTSNYLGNFGTPSFTLSDTSWSKYEYVPLEDQFGNLVSVNLQAGVQTLRSVVVNNPNLGFYMLMPVTPKLTPSLQFSYPDGLHPFEPTNYFTFTVGPANGSNILSSGIDLVLNGTDVTSSSNFKLSQGAGGSWTANYPIQSNYPYAAVINVTNTAGSNSTFTVNFDTFNVNNYQWEAVDYDFSTNNDTSEPPPQGSEFGPGWISGLFIDNPVPTADTTAATVPVGTEQSNSYFGYPSGFTASIDPFGAGAVAQQGVDIDWVPVSGQTMLYRDDSVGSQPATDYLRPKFAAAQASLGDPNIGPFNIGYYTTASWLNYTRHYPTNNYYVWGRLAGGAGPFSGTTLSLVTGGVGTGNQTNQVLGSFADPNAAGWQAWHWIPLLDTNGNMVSVSLGGLATLKLTSGNNVNAEFLMLVPAPPLFKVTPSLVAGQLNLSFPTETGHTYTVVYSGTLTSPPSWTPVGSAITGNGAVTNVTETLTGSQGYYTVIAH
jgi:hypothetical protein